MSKYPRKYINDGHYDTKDNKLRWVSNASDFPDYIIFAWSRPQTISAVRIISGWFSNGRAADPISQFKLQRSSDAGWEEVEGLRITRRGGVELAATFGPVRTDRIRLVITGTPGNISRIWEVEFYNRARAD